MDKELLNTRFNELLSLVGEPYVMLNDDGTYRGCFRVVQVLYKEAPRYNMPSENVEKNYLYGIARIKKHCIEIKPEELQKGDIIATRFRDELHVAIYYEFGKIIHVFKDHTLQIGRLKMFKNCQYFRVKQ